MAGNNTVKYVALVSLPLFAAAAVAQVAPKAPLNFAIDGVLVSGGATPPPAPATGLLPVVNAPATTRLTAGVSASRIGTSSQALLPSSDGVGAFRLSCRPSHMNFDDPLVFPGELGRAHHHTYFGNDGVDAYTNLSNLRSGTGSTCNGGNANMSAYWVPSMIDTRSGSPLTPHSVQVYYKSGYNSIPRESIQRFPEGLKLLAGNPMSTSRTDNTHYDFRCEYEGTAGPEMRGPTIPACPVGSYVWAELDFPNCWNGRDLDSPDHKAHMAYSGGGKCPSSHPVPLTQISFNVLWQVRASDDPSKWKLSSDQGAGGYSMHGDWINGWDPAIEEVWLNRCVRAGVDCNSNQLGDGRSLN
jgi:hypothetical protein